MIPTHWLSYLALERSQTTRNLLTQVLYCNWSSLLKQEHFISDIVLMNVELCRRKVINKPFISYIINTHFFHGNIWTHNWPAPNVSGFIAQLEEHRTGIARSRVQTPLKSGIFFQSSLRNCINCVHCDDHFYIFISFPQFIYDLFHISLTSHYYYYYYYY